MGVVGGKVSSCKCEGKRRGSKEKLPMCLFHILIQLIIAYFFFSLSFHRLSSAARVFLPYRIQFGTLNQCSNFFAARLLRCYMSTSGKKYKAATEWKKKTRRQLWYFHFQHNFLSFFVSSSKKLFSLRLISWALFFLLDCVWCECGKSIITACASFAFRVQIHAEEPSAEKWEEGCAIWALNNVRCTHISYSLRSRAAARAKEISFPSEIYNIVITQFSEPHIFFLFSLHCVYDRIWTECQAVRKIFISSSFFYVSARLLWWKREKKRRKNLCVRLAWWYWYFYPSEMMCYANIFI